MEGVFKPGSRIDLADIQIIDQRPHFPAISDLEEKTCTDALRFNDSLTVTFHQTQ